MREDLLRELREISERLARVETKLDYFTENQRSLAGDVEKLKAAQNEGRGVRATITGGIALASALAGGWLSRK